MCLPFSFSVLLRLSLFCQPYSIICPPHFFLLTFVYLFFLNVTVSAISKENILWDGNGLEISLICFYITSHLHYALGQQFSTFILLHFILFHFILFYSFLFYSILFCSVLFCSILFCSVLFCSVLFCSVLFCSVLFCSILFYSIPFHSFPFHSIPFCSLLFAIFLFILFYLSSGPSGWVVWLSSSWYTELTLKSHSGDSTRPCGNIHLYCTADSSP